MNGTNSFSYLRWHARDGIIRAAAPLFLFALIVGFPISDVASRDAGIEAARVPGPIHDGVAMLYRTMVGLSITLGALLVASGFVSKDREAGYVRFLFSTPVVPWRFYLERFIVSLLLFCACFALVPIAFSELVFAVPVVPVIMSSALYGALLGSLAMLAGSLTRHDGGIVIGVVAIGSVVQAVVRTADSQSPAWMTWLSKSLPPIDFADQIRTAWLAGGSADSGQLTLVLVWSFLMLVAALVVIKRAPLVR